MKTRKTKIDWALIKRLYADGVDYDEIAKAAGLPQIHQLGARIAQERARGKWDLPRRPIRRSEQWLERQRVAKLGRKHDPETIEKISAGMRLKWRDARTKKARSAEAREKISKALKGRRLTAEHRARIGEGVAGKALTPEERAERKKAVQAAWAASPAGRKWLAKNQKKKNAARKAWRAKKKAERDAAKKSAADGPSNMRAVSREE